MIVSGWPHAYRAERDKLIKLCEDEKLQKNAHQERLLSLTIENNKLRRLLDELKGVGCI